TSAQAETAPPPPPVVATDSGPPATPAPAAAPAPPPPPPAPAAVSPAKSDFRAAEQARPQALAKVAGARDLYYSAQGSADTVTKDGVVSGSKTAKKAFGGFTMPRAASPPAPVIGGVRYSILRRNLDGSFTEVDPSTVFVPGDALRLRFETNQAGNLAVM